MESIVQEKIRQAVEILREQQVDCWLTFVRETPACGDPVLPLIYGHDLTWQSALLVARSGERIAIVGELEAETARRSGAFERVVPYRQTIRPFLAEELERLQPAQIAVNYSKGDVLADGLSYGLLQVLWGYLDGTPWRERLISAEKIIAALRGRKTLREAQAIRAAAALTEQIFAETFAYAQIGMSEKDISDFMHSRLQAHAVQPAWEAENCPTVNAGPASPVGHVGPSEIRLQPGHILHIDFGVRLDGYCSDLQRVAYALRPGETQAPAAARRGLQVIVSAIQAAAEAMRPGMAGKKIDAVARRIVVEAGFESYPYGTGHHLGRLAHDGAGILGPEWEKYGDVPNYPLEAGQVYTLEPGLALPDFGYIGLEEDVRVTENGAEFLSNPQTDWVLIG